MQPSPRPEKCHVHCSLLTALVLEYVLDLGTLIDCLALPLHSLCCRSSRFLLSFVIYISFLCTSTASTCSSTWTSTCFSLITVLGYAPDHAGCLLTCVLYATCVHILSRFQKLTRLSTKILPERRHRSNRTQKAIRRFFKGVTVRHIYDMGLAL